MPSISSLSRALLATLFSILWTVPALAFDVGYEKSNAKGTFSFKLETIVERYYRTLQIPTEDIARSWDLSQSNDPEGDISRFTTDPYLVGELHAYNLIIRPTITIKQNITGYVDLAVFDDVKTTAAPPYMLGAGGYISREIYPGVTAALFGSLHITNRYKYSMELLLNETSIYEAAEFEGRMYIGSGGLLIGWEVNLEDVDIMPYIGLENSLHRTTSTIKQLCRTRGCQVDELNHSGNFSAKMNEDEFLFALAGITLRRPNETTMRFEGHVSQEEWMFSGGLGIKF